MPDKSLTDYFSMSLDYAERDALFTELLHILHRANKVNAFVPRLTAKMDDPRYAGTNIGRFNRLCKRLIRLYSPRCTKCGELLSECDCTMPIPYAELMRINYHV